MCYRFKSSKNSHTVDVNLDDQIDFVCPIVAPGGSAATSEYYVIYQVDFYIVSFLFSICLRMFHY